MILLWACVTGLAASSVAKAAGTVYADNSPTVATLPLCALQCLATLIPQSTCASPSNITCICTNEELTAATTACLATKCTVTETLLTVRYQKSTCGAPVRNKSALVRRTTWTFFTMALVAVISRFVARSKIMKGAGYGLDDWAILACLPLCFAGDILLDQTSRYGLGTDVWMLAPESITKVIYLFWVQEFVYLTLMTGTKISVLLLYLRIFPSTVSTWFRRSCYLVIGLLVGYCLSMCISTAVECNPISYAWTRWDGEHKGHCINTVAQIYMGASLNIVFDVLVFFLPIPKLYKLNTSTPRKKIGIILTFLVGLFVTICSIIRLRYLVRWGESTNPTWDYTSIGIWSVIEGNAAIFCCCMPAMAGPIKRFWTRMSDSISHSVHTSSKFGDNGAREYDVRNVERPLHGSRMSEKEIKPAQMDGWQA